MLAILNNVLSVQKLKQTVFKSGFGLGNVKFKSNFSLQQCVYKHHLGL